MMEYYRFNLHLHWTTTIFILTLALADLLYCVVNLPLGTIHLRRRQIVMIFYPNPPTIGILAKCLWRGFLIYVLWPFEHWHMRTSSPLRHADVLNGWSLIIFLFYRFNLHLHWTTTIFILNLALADFLYCVVNLPLYALQYLHQRWIWGPNLCYYTAGDSRTIVRITSTC